MRIEFKREGGLAYFPGLSRPRSVESRELPPAQAEALEAQVRAARFFELPSVVGASSPGADRMRYTLSIEENGRRHTVQFLDPVEEPQLRALLELVQKLEKEHRAEARTHE